MARRVSVLRILSAACLTLACLQGVAVSVAAAPSVTLSEGCQVFLDGGSVGPVALTDQRLCLDLDDWMPACLDGSMSGAVGAGPISAGFAETGGCSETGDPCDRDQAALDVSTPVEGVSWMVWAGDCPDGLPAVFATCPTLTGLIPFHGNTCTTSGECNANLFDTIAGVAGFPVCVPKGSFAWCDDGLGGVTPAGPVCQDLDFCEAPEQGIDAGAASVCEDVCTLPSVGVLGLCYSVCASPGPPVSVGVTGPAPINHQCHDIAPCDQPGKVGATVDGSIGGCVDAPGPCPPGFVGVKGPIVGSQCRPYDDCDAPATVGLVVDGLGGCFGTCDPPGTFGLEDLPVLGDQCRGARLCDQPMVGVIVGPVTLCVEPPTPCTPPSLGTQGGPLGTGCRTAEPCPLPSVGVRIDGSGDCHTADACPVPSVGVRVDGSGDCHTAELCSGSFGVIVDGAPLCHTVDDCDVPQTVGVVVAGPLVNAGSCEPVPGFCSSPQVGVTGQCHQVSTCDPGAGSFGVAVTGDTVNHDGCGPVPSLCDAPTIGVKPDCYQASTCDPASNSWGVKLTGPEEIGECVQL